MTTQKVLQALDTLSWALDKKAHANHKAIARDVAIEKLRIQDAIDHNAPEYPTHLHYLYYQANNGDGNTFYEITAKLSKNVIEVNASRGLSDIFNIKIAIPGEIINAGLANEDNKSGTPSRTIFSTTNGQSGVHAFDLVDLVADAIVMERHGLIPDGAADDIELDKLVADDSQAKVETIYDLKPSSTLFEFLGARGELVFPGGDYLGVSEKDGLFSIHDEAGLLCHYGTEGHLSYLRDITPQNIEETLSTTLLEKDFSLTNMSLGSSEFGQRIKVSTSIFDFLKSDGRLFFPNNSTMEAQRVADSALGQEKELLFSTPEGDKWRYELSEAGLAKALASQYLPNEENEIRMS